MNGKVKKAIDMAISQGANPTSSVARWVGRENEKIEIGYCDREQFKSYRSSKSHSLFFEALSKTNANNDFCLHFKRYTNEGVLSYLFSGVIDGSGNVALENVIYIEWSSHLVCKLNKNNDFDNMDPDLLELAISLSQIFTDNFSFAQSRPVIVLERKCVPDKFVGFKHLQNGAAVVVTNVCWHVK